jgi:hypothetical protein
MRKKGITIQTSIYFRRYLALLLSQTSAFTWQIRTSNQATNLIRLILLVWAWSGVKMTWVEWGRLALHQAILRQPSKRRNGRSAALA